ncbi:unnamed protein product [marine sediment metagenome]|uniref:Uncharacterized protein n=1 Tax=marine sediment metagenome TaxID=412755 RepID=X0YZX4_9ZZZZ
MAIAKQVKIGGAYYKGYTIDVLSAAGTYSTFMALTTGGSAVNSVSIIPDSAGAGDKINMFHTANSTGGKNVATLAEDIPNLGAKVPINLDLIAMERIDAGEALKVSYINVASIAMNVHIIVERGR